MKVYFIGAGPGAPDLITLRGHNLLKQCNVCVYAGSLVSKEHLNILDKHTSVYNSATMSLEEIGDVFLNAKKLNHNVARLHTGDPSLYGSIGEQIAFCIENEIECEVVPGVSSFSASVAALKKELTLPGISQTVILTRCEGRTPVPARERLEELAKSQSSMCIFLSAKLIQKVSDALIQQYPAKTPVAIVYKATWPDQKIIQCTLSDLTEQMKKQRISKTAMILVGEFLQRQGEASCLYDAGFTHAYRTGKTSNAK